VKGVVFQDEAKAELIGAIAYYDGQRDGLGDDLLAAVDRAIERISERPNSFPKSSRRGYRKCLLQQFPYTIHFIDSEDTIWIMAVAHRSRKPDYWTGREPG
jgi:toxin ParE1/3/4